MLLLVKELFPYQSQKLRSYSLGIIASTKNTKKYYFPKLALKIAINLKNRSSMLNFTICT